MNHTKMPVVYRHFLFHEKAYTIMYRFSPKCQNTKMACEMTNFCRFTCHYIKTLSDMLFVISDLFLFTWQHQQKPLQVLIIFPYIAVCPPILL